MTAYPHEVAEMALAHVVGDKVEAPTGVVICSRNAAGSWRIGPPTVTALMSNQPK